MFKNFCYCVIIMLLCYRGNSLWAKSEPEADYTSPFTVDSAVDGSIILLSASIVFVPLLTESEIPYRDSSTLDRGDVNSFDRSVIGNHNNSFRRLSDVGSALIPLSVYGLTFLYDKDNTKSEIIEDFTIMAESVLVSGAFYQIFSHAFARPRPYMYTDEKRGARHDNWDYRSFYSGHTANAMAVSTTIAYIHSVRYPGSPYTALLWTTAAVGCVAVGGLRVAGGDHFYSDIAMGMVTGFSIGLLVPVLHERERYIKGAVRLSMMSEGIGFSFYF